MTISLYEATVPGFIQIVGAVRGFLVQTRKHCSEAGTDLNGLLEARLIADMLPLSFQLRAVVKNSVVAIEDTKKGAFSMPVQSPTLDFAGYEGFVADAASRLATYSKDEINALEGTEVAMNTPGSSVAFSAEDFLLSFSLPNFYFHAATAYDILRMSGVPLGKRDFLGTIRHKG
jgi:hypothetical protein